VLTVTLQENIIKLKLKIPLVFLRGHQVFLIQYALSSWADTLLKMTLYWLCFHRCNVTKSGANNKNKNISPVVVKSG
jgi:hypothetical protein